MISNRLTFRFAVVSLLLFVLCLPAVSLSTYERVFTMNVGVDNGVRMFRVYCFGAKDDGEPVGHGVIGPPAWDNTTNYFSGDVFEVERTTNGFRVAMSGTFGPKVLANRHAAEAFVTVESGKVSVSGLPGTYSFGLTKTLSGRIQAYPAATPDN